VTVTHVNHNPVIGGGGIAGPALAVRGQALSYAAVFTDADVLDTHTALISWGDSTSTAGSVSEILGAGATAGSHTYTASGTYTITWTIADNHGGTVTATKQITISAAAIEPDPTDPSKTAPFVRGDTGN